MTRQAAAFPPGEVPEDGACNNGSLREVQSGFPRERVGFLDVLEQLSGLQAESLWLLLTESLSHLDGNDLVTVPQAVSGHWA